MAAASERGLFTVAGGKYGVGNRTHWAIEVGRLGRGRWSPLLECLDADLPS